MKKIIVISWFTRKAFELELFSNLNKYNNYKINYYLTDKNSVYFTDNRCINKFENINFIVNKADNIDIWIWNIVIFFYYIPDDNTFLNLDTQKNKFIYLWNVYPVVIEGQNIFSKHIDLETYHFHWEDKQMKRVIQNSFINSKINNIKNIYLPSGIAWIIENENIRENKFNNNYLYDIVVVLWSWLDFVTLDKVVRHYKNKKILIIWINSQGEYMLENKSIIQKWSLLKNVTLTKILDTKKLYLLLKLSKIAILAFSKNQKQNITRISDFFFLWKCVISTKIDANKNFEFVNFCKTFNDFREKIDYSLDNWNYKASTLDIKQYYENNFRISTILNKILKK